MDKLTLYGKYTRKEVHDYFVPGGQFTPNAGTWGLHGCVLIPNSGHDYVFFVTYGQSQGDHFFQEGISEDGVITWQSQPRQHFREHRIIKWINQNERGDVIHLFVRPKKGLPYTYFGDISYLSHDEYKEYPVWFEFKLNHWDAPASIIADFVRAPTAGFRQGPETEYEFLGEPRRTSNAQTSKANLKRRSLALNDFDLHVRNLLKSNLHLIDAGEGYRWEENYEFDLGDQADIVFFGPGREAKIVAICTAEEQVSYLKAVQAKLWRHQLCYEQSEEESSEFIQCYLVAKSVNENTKDFCRKYGVNLLIV